jgi:anti-sigma-K factor RskA
VVRSADQGVAMLIGSDLPDLPSGKVYEAWTFDGDTPIAAGTFTASGEETMHVLPAAGVDTSTVAVTVEPEGGSDAPTSDPVVVVDLS